MTTKEEQEAARALTEFLTKRDGYNRTSPLETVIQAKIRALMGQVADETIAATPGLVPVLRERVQAAIAATLRDDDWLNQRVTQAVAKALTNSALEDDE